MFALTRVAVICLFAAFATASWSGEIVLYQYPDFMGRSIALRGLTPDLENRRFNDRAASIFVRDGDWEVCTDANFRGNCQVLRPGEYRQLPHDFVDRISSAREVGRSSYSNYVPLPPVASQRIEFFSSRRFRGGSLTLTAAVPDLRHQGFNDVPASAIVTGGPWELCTEPGFRGNCRVLSEGQHESLSWDLNHQVSSARPLPREGLRETPREMRPYARPAQAPAAVLFDGFSFRGRSVALRGAVTDLEHIGFNDRAESIRIDSGVWEFCTDANFGGECRRFSPGEYPDLDRALGRRISSARPVEAPPRRPRESQQTFQFGPNAL